MKDASLLKKILVMIGVPVIIAFVLTMGVTQFFVKNAISDLRTSDLDNSSAYTTQLLDKVFTKYLEIANQLAANQSVRDLIQETGPGQKVYLMPDYPNVAMTMDNVAETDSSILYSWIADTDASQYVQSDEQYAPDDYQITQRPWYIQLEEKKEPFVSEPYEDYTSNDTIVSVVSPIFKAGTSELIGAACVDISITDIATMVGQQKLGETGNYMMTTDTGQIFYHPNQDYIGKNISEIDATEPLKAAVQNKQIGELQFSFDGEKSRGYISEIGDTGWMLTSVLPDKEFNETSVTMSILLFVILVIVLIVLVGLIFTISKKIANPLKRVAYVVEEMSQGHFGERLEVEGKDEIGLMSQAINVFADDLQHNVVKVMKQISEGNVSMEIIAKDENDEISPAMKNMVDTIRKLNLETQSLTQAITVGELSQRGNEADYAGSWKELISGINGLIDSFVKPFNVSADYIEKISKGEIPLKITEAYSGDFNKMKDNLNTCIDAINLLVEDAYLLSQSTLQGNLSVRADSSRHGGDFAKIIDGVNHSIDALIEPIDMMAKYLNQIGKGQIPEKITVEYRGDFAKIKDSINDSVDGLAGLAEGIEILGLMGKNNDYSKAVSGSYAGIYADMAESINQVSETIKHVIQTLNHIATGDLSDLQWLKPIGKRSDNDELMPAIITMSERIQNLIDEASVLTEAALQGRLDTKVDDEKFEGAWKDLIIKMNSILEGAAKPLNEVTSVLNELSKGNLKVSVNGSYSGQFDVLKKAINFTIDHLREIIQEITDILGQMAEKNLAIEHLEDFVGDYSEITDSLQVIIQSLNQVMVDFYEAAEQVNMGANQVSQGSQALSQGSTEQASAIEQLTASIADIANQTRENAINANTANDLAETAKNNAQSGNSQMSDMLTAMTDINESSANISKIIKVIDDIAFQTNILALNAAVEAARAGQHGKGFAVVAEEVRTLAARSAEAARETTDLIEGSINKVKAGTQIANDTAEALREIVEGIDKAATLVHGIAEASNSQASAIAEVNKGIEQVSLVVQNNSATAEESAASSEELSGQAGLLKNMVGEFKLRQTQKNQGAKKVMRLTDEHSMNNKKNTNQAPQILMDYESNDKY